MKGPWKTILGASAVLCLSGDCSRKDKGPLSLPPPKPPVYRNYVARKLQSLHPEDTIKGLKPSKEMLDLLGLYVCGIRKLEVRAGRNLMGSWEKAREAVAFALKSDKYTPGTKLKLLRLALSTNPRDAVKLSVYALEAKPNQALSVRREAYAILFEHATEEEVPSLVLRLKYEEYLDKKCLAIVSRILARHLNLSGIEYLVRMVKERLELETAGSYLIEALRLNGMEWKEGGTWEELTRKSEELLRTWKEKGRSPRDGRTEVPLPLEKALLIKLEACRNFNMRYQDEALFILSHSGWTAVPAIELGLLDKSPEIRITCIQACSRLGPVAKRAGGKLVQILGDKLAGQYAAEALGKIGYKEAIPYLVFLARVKEHGLRQAAILSLGRLGAKEFLPVLEEILSENTLLPEEKMACALALGLLGKSTRARDMFKELEKSPDVHRETLEEYEMELENLEKKGR